MKKTYKLLLGFCVLIFVGGVDAQPAGEWMWINGSNIQNSVGNFGVRGVPSPTNEPPAVYEACEWRDLNGNFWIFGGVDSAGISSSLWKYVFSINEWTWMGGPDTIIRSAIL